MCEDSKARAAAPTLLNVIADEADFATKAALNVEVGDGLEDVGNGSIPADSVADSMASGGSNQAGCHELLVRLAFLEKEELPDRPRAEQGCSKGCPSLGGDDSLLPANDAG